MRVIFKCNWLSLLYFYYYLNHKCLIWNDFSPTDEGTVLNPDIPATIKSSSYNNANPTKIIIPSYMPTGRVEHPWYNTFRIALHSQVNCLYLKPIESLAI